MAASPLNYTLMQFHMSLEMVAGALEAGLTTDAEEKLPKWITENLTEIDAMTAQWISTADKLEHVARLLRKNVEIIQKSAEAVALEIQMTESGDQKRSIHKHRKV